MTPTPGRRLMPSTRGPGGRRRWLSLPTQRSTPASETPAASDDRSRVNPGRFDLHEPSRQTSVMATTPSRNPPAADLRGAPVGANRGGQSLRSGQCRDFLGLSHASPAFLRAIGYGQLMSVQRPFEANRFLAQFGFTEDPFASTNAADEPNLSHYFVEPPYFASVMGDPRRPSPTSSLLRVEAGRPHSAE